VLIVDEQALGELVQNGVVDLSEWQDILDRLLRRLDQVYFLRDIAHAESRTCVNAFLLFTERIPC
jgi:hypothetical protein